MFQKTNKAILDTGFSMLDTMQIGYIMQPVSSIQDPESFDENLQSGILARSELNLSNPIGTVLKAWFPWKVWD